MRRLLLPVCVALVQLSPSMAQATYSIVATDSATRHIGGAGTSCVGSLSVTIILGLAPDIGAIHAQAQINTQGRDQGVTLLKQGKSPAEIIMAITAPAFDPIASARQYGVVDLMGRHAGWTGSTNGNYADDRQGQDGEFTYSVQGNILTGAAVIDNTEAGFVNGGGCDLPDRLMIALEAGAMNGEGDSRCTDDGIPSDSGFLHVVDSNGNDIVLLDVTNTAPMNPLVELRAEYDVWRASHPCADGTTGGDSDGTGSGSGSDSSADSGSETDSGSATDGPGTTGTSDDSGITGGADSTDSSSGGSVTIGETEGVSTGASDMDESGCGCRTSRERTPTMAVLFLAMLALRRRRRKATVDCHVDSVIR